MFKYKKTAALIMSILICTASVTASAYSVFAEETEEAALYTDSEDEGIMPLDQEEDGLITSGDYVYSMTNDGNVCIEDYLGSDENVIIPENIDGKLVEELGSQAFFETSVVSVHIPSGVNYIYDNPFLECPDFKEVTVDENNENFYSVDGVLYAYYDDGDTLRCYPQGKEGDTYTIPDGITEIQASAIYNTMLTELKLPASLIFIDHHGVSYNEKLVSVNLEETSIDELGDMCFSYCTALEAIVLPDSCLQVGGAAFAGCKSLKSVKLNDSLISIKQNAFAATGLTKIKIPSSVTAIGYCAFGYDENLEPVSNFTIIGASGSIAQSYCTDSDAEYDYQNSFTFVESANEALYEEAASLEYNTYEDFTYAISGREAFITGCASVDSVIEIPSEINGLPVTKIYAGSFFQSSATEIIVPESVREIGCLAFYLCSNLKRLTLPDGLEVIDNQAFADCNSLESLEIPGSVTSIGEDVFLGCGSIKEFTVRGSGGGYCAENGVLYNSDKTAIVYYPPAKEDKEYKAPDTAKEILMSAFMEAYFLESVDISSVVTIGDYAFEDCTALSNVKFSKDLDKIGTASFYGCTSLKSVSLYENITEIGSVALGYYYGSTGSGDGEDSETYGDVHVEGFVIYAPGDSGGARYAKINNIECVTNTVNIFGLNVEKGFLYVIAGIIAALVLAVVGINIGKNIKKKKRGKEEEERKKSLQENLDKKRSGKDESEENNEPEEKTE